MDLFTTADPGAARAAALWCGLLILLLITLSGLVVRQRQRLRVGYGDGESPELMGASRAFGNATEYAPAAMAGLALMAMVSAAPWLIHLVGATRSRIAGMMLTYVSLLVLAVVLIAFAVP